MRISQTKIADRINFTKIEDDKFQLSKISVNLITPLNRETACENALISYLFKNGCKKYPNQTALNRHLGLMYGAFLESDVRKNGDNQIISLTAGTIGDSYAINNEPLTLNLAQLLTEVLLDPPFENGTFSSSSVSLEKEMLKDAILSSINDKRSYAIDKAIKLSCKDEPFGVSSLGEVEDLDKITPETLKTRWQSLLSESAIEIFICSNAVNDNITSVFENAFKELDRKGNFTPKTKYSPAITFNETTEQMNVTQTKLVLMFKSNCEIPENLATALSVMNTLYGGGAYSKLFTNVREKMSLCYYCSSISDRLKGIIVADCGTQNTDAERAKKAMLHEFEDIQNGNFTDEEFLNTKKALITSCKAVTDSVSGVLSWYLTSKITGRNKSPEQEIEELNNVTREDVIKVAKLFSLNLSYILTGGGEDE